MSWKLPTKEKYEKYTFEIFKNILSNSTAVDFETYIDNDVYEKLIKRSYNIATLFMEQYEIRTQEASEIHE
jgi:hypothetical protein